MFNRKYIFNWWILNCNVSLSEGEATRLVSKHPLNTPDLVLNHGTERRRSFHCLGAYGMGWIEGGVLESIGKVHWWHKASLVF